jgi:hypothetical protein
MLKLKMCLLSLLVMAVMAVPVMAGNNEAKTANDTANATSAEASPAASSLISTSVDANATSSSADPNSSPQAKAMPQGAPPPVPPPAVVPAIVPLRVLPIDPPKTGGLNGIKVGPLTLAPYGFVKTTFVHDSSMPDGDDMPSVGLFFYSNSINNTGPTQDPEIHIKARSTRFGLNLEWPDISPRLTLTGKIEGDFEGNYNESANADVTSIRNPNPRLRMAIVRMDYHASESTDIYFIGGQDWTLFGSGALPNILETTILGGFYGSAYTRSPQMKVGFVETLSKEHHIKFEPTFGVMMPSTGQVERLATSFSNGLQNQIGQAEREGADADRPEYEGRLALSFQLDKARGVSPAQIALSGFYGKRTSIVTGATYFSGGVCTLSDPNYCAAFPNGFQSSSKQYGGQLTLQLPTRWFTLVGSAWRGGDLRFYAATLINSFFTNVNGLYNVTPSQPTTSGGPYLVAGGAALGCNVNPGDGDCPVGNVVVAPEKPVRGFGGFVQLGLPLSRWFNANPAGHNAGWQLYFTLGKDQTVSKDINNPSAGAPQNIISPLPISMGKMAIATLNYRFNNWCQFSFEQSVYANRLDPNSPTGLTEYVIAGVPSHEWQDHRTEFGPTFTF